LEKLEALVDVVLHLVGRLGGTSDRLSVTPAGFENFGDRVLQPRVLLITAQAE
jgi:hypothetical protein